MKKADFVRYVKSIIKPLSTTEQINTLEKMKTWLDEVIAQKKEKNIYCYNCKKYSNESKFKTVYQTEYREETTYRDSAYGDSDLHGTVERFVTYSVCPCCGHKKEINALFMRIVSEYDRLGNRIQ